MGTNSPESYFEEFNFNKVKYGIINCFDGHSIDADSLNKMNKHKFTNFYNVNDGCMTEHYVICSPKKLTKKQVEELDEYLASLSE